MLRLVRSGVAAYLAGVVAVCAGSAWGGEYVFRDVVNSTSGMYAFTNPVINDRGTIAFFATTDELGGFHQVYIQSKDGALRRFTGAGFADALFGLPINEQDDVAFVRWPRTMAEPPEGQIFRGNAAGDLSVIASGGDNLEIDMSHPSLWITESGQVLYNAQVGREGDFLLRGPNPVTDRVMPVYGPGWIIDGVSHDGTPVVRATEAGSWAFYKGVDREQVAMRAGTAFSGVAAYRENHRGDQVFWGRQPGGSSGRFPHGIFSGPDPKRDAIVRSGTYERISGPVLNDEGTVVFTADLAAGGYGIFTGPAAEDDGVIVEGDVLFGSTVRDVEVQAFYSLNPNTDFLNNLGQIVFAYELASGVSGIAVATPVPEAGVVGALGLVVVLGCRRRGGK